MGKYEVGDKVLVKMVVDDINSNDDIGAWVGLERGDTSDGMWLIEEQLDKYIYKTYSSKTYEDGLNDAWELARKIYDFSCNKVEEIYGVDGGFYGLMKNYSAQEALAKIEAYEKEKQIEVGDVVEYESDNIQGVVIDILSDEECYIYNENGCIEEHQFEELRKTDRYIDIDSLLEQIRGDD